MKKKTDKDERTLFEKLFDEKICFAIVVSRTSFISSGASRSVPDVGCIFNFIDKEIVQRLGIDTKQPRDGRGVRLNDYNIVEYDMTREEYQEFKTLQHKFIKVNHNKDGRNYELLTDPFKKRYDELNVRNV